MLAPSLSSVPLTFNPMDHTKINPGHLYLRQQHKLEIIQLVEGPPPSPRPLASIMSSSTASSSSYSSYDDDDSFREDEDSESACSSYCSSDAELPEAPGNRAQELSRSDEGFSRRMNRVCAWREKFAKVLPSPSAEYPPFMMRRHDHNNHENDTISPSPSPQRGRTHAPSGGKGTADTLHACPACDASFPSRQSLRLHGRAKDASEACAVAVEYDFE